MAKSKYEYVREFESATDHRLLLNTFIVVRVDGQCFHRFSKEHNFFKPNDKRCLDLMNRSALHVMRSFYPNIIMAYGQSDEYSFVLRRFANFFNRRQNKLTSLITSTFTSAFIFHWNDFFNLKKNVNLIPSIKNININDNYNNNNGDDNYNSKFFDQKLKYPASFDGRCILYPNETTLIDYLKWRQVDCHVNNLYNTTYHALTGEYTSYEMIDNEKCLIKYPYNGPKLLKPLNGIEATKKLSGSSSGDKNEILFTDYGINYNNELEQFRKGTIITLNLETSKSLFEELAKNNNNNKSSNNSEMKKSKKSTNDNDKIDKMKEIPDQELFKLMNIDIISEKFWIEYESLLKL